ncbi:hypothetical protein DFJ74DRAFT_669296 [Hyaloraphidium curvatum]|nr:hypothetical protein DFJ74DRAFT_669296 [Hyaloraphidium curvatum]
MPAGGATPMPTPGGRYSGSGPAAVPGTLYDRPSTVWMVQNMVGCWPAWGCSWWCTKPWGTWCCPPRNCGGAAAATPPGPVLTVIITNPSRPPCMPSMSGLMPSADSGTVPATMPAMPLGSCTSWCSCGCCMSCTGTPAVGLGEASAASAEEAAEGAAEGSRSRASRPAEKSASMSGLPERPEGSEAKVNCCGLGGPGETRRPPSTGSKKPYGWRSMP